LFIAEICGNIAEICGFFFSTIVKPTFPAGVAMAQGFQEAVSLSVVSTEPIPPNPWENEAVGAAIWQNHLSPIAF